MSHIIDRDVPRYTRLGNILNKNFFFLRALSHFVDQAEYDSLANAALFVSEKGGCTLPLIHAIVASEFERNVRTPGSIMRGNCVASKLMGAYSRQNGKDFMKNCVGDLVMEVVNKGSDYLLEINPSQISGEDSNEKLENNQKELQNLAELFIERIISPETLQLMPRGIRAIAGFTAEYARKYASDRLCPLVGGFLMLRLLNPALITPESLGLLPEGVRPSKESRRNLTLISKILQNLSNGILFGAKEPYMTCMNGIIEKHTESFKAFLYEVAKDEESEDEPWETFKNITPTLLEKSDFLDEQKSFMVLHSLLAMFRGRLLEGLNERVMMNNAAGKIQDYDEEEELFQLLDELPEPDLKKKNSSQEPQTEVTFLTKTLKSGQLLKKKGKFSRKEVPHRLVLTENFGHLFSSDEEKKPFQSVPIIELVTPLVEENETTFRFGFADKFFEIQCESPAEVKDWVSTIARLQSKKHNSTTEMGKRELTALERRILNHLSGVQVKYSAQSLGWEPAPDETVVFIVQVRAFGSVWYLQKKWNEYLQLHDSLSSSFPHFIFPSFPPVYEEEEGMEGEGIPPPGTRSPPPMSSPPTTPTLSSFPTLSPRHIPSVRPTSPSSPPPSTSPSSPSTSPIASPRLGNEGEDDSAGGLMTRGDVDGQLLICMEGDVPSRGAIFGSNYLSGYLSALVQNFTIAQSSDLFDFLELSNMARVIEESSREQLQHLMRKQVDVNGMIDGMSPLHMAVHKKKVSAVRMLCDCGAIVDARDTNRNTPLHVACQIGAVRVVKELVMIGANLELKNKQEQTPFFVACENGHTDVVEFLMTQGVSTVVLDRKQQTAVSVATSEGHEDVVACIAMQRKDEEWEDDASFRYQDGSTLLHMAASLGLPELFSSLLEYLSIDINTQSHFGVTALHHAAKGGKSEVTQIILNDPSVDPSVCDDYGRTPLCLAVMEGHLEVVKLLLPVTDTTIQTNKGESLLFIAIEGGFVDIVQEIIKLDPAVIKEDRNKEGEDPLTVAIQNGEVEVVRALVKGLKGEETQGKNPLYLAVLVGNEQILKILLENGADAVNFRTEEGLSLLHVACYSNSPKIATILCQIGTSTKHADLQGNTPLHLSASLSLPSLLEIFLETGGGGERNEEGDTPVHLACLSGSLDCLKKLVQNNKNLISSTNNEGSSPLHIAVEETFVEGAIFLTETGGDVTLKNKAKQTPLSLACPALKKMLLEAAGKEEEED